MYVRCALIHQASAQLIASLSAFPCGGLFNYQIITFTFPLLASLSLAIFGPPVVIENWQLSAVRHVLHEELEEDQHCPLIHYNHQFRHC